MPSVIDCCFQVSVPQRGWSCPGKLGAAGGAAHSEGALPPAQGPATSQEGLLGGGPRGWQLVFRREPWADAPEGTAGPVERSEQDENSGSRTPNMVSLWPVLGSLH